MKTFKKRTIPVIVSHARQPVIPTAGSGLGAAYVPVATPQKAVVVASTRQPIKVLK